MNVISLIVAITSLFIAVSMPFLYDRLRAPKLSAVIPTGEPSVQPLPGTRRGFYHVNIVNRNVEFRGRRLFFRNPSYLSRITMRFMDEKEKELFIINGKWDRGPEPLIPEIIENKVVYAPFHSLVPFSETIDIPPGEQGESFCLVMKYEGEDECWGFSAWSYIHGWQQGLRDPKSKLGKGKYLVDVYVTTANVKKVFRFILENKGRRLEDISVKGPYTL